MTTEDDDDGAARLAALLPDALARRSAEAFAELLDPDVRWGGADETEETCHGRDEVLAFYAGLLSEGVTLAVQDSRVEGQQVRMTVRVQSPGDSDGPVADEVTLMTVRDGLVVDVLQLGPDEQ